jgi:uncharacterized protein involved in outer membrane biogenesis
MTAVQSCCRPGLASKRVSRGPAPKSNTIDQRNDAFALAADKIDTAELQGISATPQSAVKPRAHPANKPSLIDAMTGSGTLAANTIKAQDLVLNNVRTNCKLNHGVVTLSPLPADLYGGKENGVFSVDTRPVHPLLSAKAKFSGVDRTLCSPR